jgi:hypothetical protein
MSEKTARVIVGLLATVAFCISLAAGHLFFQNLSLNNDEAVYVLEAQMFGQGDVTLSDSAHGDAFRPWMSGRVGGDRLVLVQQPTLPALMALSDALFGTMRIALAAIAAAAVVAMGLSLDQPVTELLQGLQSFRGAGRRFELKASIAGIRVIDDYGHHPTEIDVTLTAARRYAGDGRVLVLFQPHRYSRTQAFLDSFARTLDLADHAILLEIYPASESAIPGVSSSLITERMQRGVFIPNFLEAAEAMISMARPGDVILTLGAGDVNSLAPIIIAGLEQRFEINS